MQYGFLDNMLDHYDAYLYERVIETFDWLPLAALCGPLFVVHGGLFQYPDVTLDELRTALALERGQDVPRRSQLTRRSQFLVENALWSDPLPEASEDHARLPPEERPLVLLPPACLPPSF